MKYLIFSDIHGNNIALEVLKNSQYFKNVDKIVCLGDAIAIGPNGKEVLQILKTIPNLLMVRGNHERYLLYGFNNPGSCTEIGHQKWVWSKLDENDVEFLKSLPTSITIEDHGYKILFIHYAMKSELKYSSIIHNPNVDDLDELFKDYPVDIICYGHEHVASTFNGKKIYINTGSLGCPCKAPYTLKAVLLDINQDVTIENIEIEYDPSSLAETIRKEKMPDGEFIIENFLGLKKAH